MSGGGLRSRVSGGAWRKPGTSTPRNRAGRVGRHRAPTPRRPVALIAAVAVMLAAGLGLTATGLAAAPVGASTAPGAVASLDLCATPAAGQLRCFGVRRTDVSQPAALASQPSVATPDATPAGYGPGRPGLGLSAGHQPGQRPDRRGGRRLRRPERRGRPGGVPRPVRPAGLHHRQRLLPQGQPGRRQLAAARRRTPAGPPRSRWTSTWSPRSARVQHPAGRGHQRLHQRPRHRRRHRGRARREVRLQQLRRRRRLRRPGRRHFNHPGVAITASTGDNGYGVDFPATARRHRGRRHLAGRLGQHPRLVRDAPGRGAGSGCSAVFAKPAIQNLVSTGCAKRAVADVSAVADPSTGVAVYTPRRLGRSTAAPARPRRSSPPSTRWPARRAPRTIPTATPTRTAAASTT